MIEPNIYEWIKNEENRFETEDVQVGDNYNWSFRNHVQMIFHLKNGVFFTGDNNYLRAFKEVMQPMIDLANWTEDLEVKDTTFFIEGKDDRVASFFIKKYHDEVYSRENNLDTLYDEITESDNTYGGVLIQDGPEIPEVIKFKRIAFADQTDLLGSPVAFKYFFSPDKLRGMSKLGWGDEKNGATISLEELCTLAQAEKEPAGNQGKKNQTPGKQIEVYIVKGSLPEHYLKDSDNMEDYYNQVQIVAFYYDKDSKRQGVTLYRKKANEDDLMFFTSSEVEDRALGRGVGERLIHPQIWTNFLTIHKMSMLEAGSKVPLYTDDSSYTTKNKIQDMESLEITTIEDGKRIFQVPTVAPANVQLYQNAVNEWYEQSQIAGDATNSLMGKEESSGTTFKGQERLVAQGKGPHDRKRGKRAKFIEEIYRKKIIPKMVKKMLQGKKFLSTLTTDELTWVSEQLAINKVNKEVMDRLFRGQPVYKEEQDMMIEQEKKNFLKKGNTHLLEILKGEFEDVEIRMGINIAGKQKNLANLSDKVLSIFQYIFANPQAFQQSMKIPALSKAFQDILEFSGLNQADFSSLLNVQSVDLALPEQQIAQQLPEQMMQV